MNKEEIDKLEDYLRNELPKIEPTIPITGFGSVNLDDLMDSIKQFKKVPTFDELLRENKILREQLEEKDKIIKDLQLDSFIFLKNRINQGMSKENMEKHLIRIGKNIIDNLERGKNGI